MNRKVSLNRDGFCHILNEVEFDFTKDEGDLGEYISYNLSWTKHMSEQCSKANKMLRFIRFIINTRFVMSSTMVRRSLCQSDPTWATPRTCMGSTIQGITLRNIDRDQINFEHYLFFCIAYKDTLQTDLIDRRPINRDVIDQSDQ